MENTNSHTSHFYCIRCRTLKERKDAAAFFQTGYYYNTIHLGVCGDCASSGHVVSKEGEDTD